MKAIHIQMREGKWCVCLKDDHVVCLSFKDACYVANFHYVVGRWVVPKL